MAAVAAAGDSAISALNNLASTVMGVYDAVGERKVGKSDLLFSITDWASLLRFAEQPLQRALASRETQTQARALRVLDLNAALASWLAGIGFKMTAAEAGWWSRPRVRSEMPRFFLAKKAARFEGKLELVKRELKVLMEEVERLPVLVQYSYNGGEDQTVAPVQNRIQEIPVSEKMEDSEALPETSAVVSRLRFATEKIGGKDTGKRVHSAP